MNSAKIDKSNNIQKNISQSKINKKIGIFGFFALTGSIIMNIFLYPSFASAGYATILFLIVGGLLWFIPVALCSAEMATVKTWNQKGGLYCWTKMMWGKKWGWAAIFYQWFQTTIIYFVVLDFVVTGFAYLAGTPDYFNQADHEAIKWVIMISIFGFLTILNMFGIKLNTIIARIGLFGGVITPAILLIAFGFFSISSHAIPIVTPFSGNKIIPTFSKDALHNIGIFVIFATFLLSYTGLEESASAIRRLKNPGKNYPIVVIMLAVLIILFSSLGSVTIVMLINFNDPSSIVANNPLTNGVYGVFYKILITHNVFALGGAGSIILFKFIVFWIIIGSSSQINSIIIGPSTGIHEAFIDMKFPKVLNKVNRFGVHYNILAIQFALMCFWSLVMNFAAGVGDISFTICVNLTALTYLIAYLLLFSSYIKLNWLKKSNNKIKLKRDFQIKGGKYIKVLIAGIGFLLSAATMVITLFNPGANNAAGIALYLSLYLPIIIPLWIFILLVPFIIYAIHFIYKYKKPIYNFLIKEKKYSKKSAKNIYKMFKSKTKNSVAIKILLDEGIDKKLVSEGNIHF